MLEARDASFFTKTILIITSLWTGRVVSDRHVLLTKSNLKLCNKILTPTKDDYLVSFALKDMPDLPIGSKVLCKRDGDVRIRILTGCKIDLS